jgi:hypothetical protein
MKPMWTARDMIRWPNVVLAPSPNWISLGYSFEYFPKLSFVYTFFLLLSFMLVFVIIFFYLVILANA